MFVSRTPERRLLLYVSHIFNLYGWSPGPSYEFQLCLHASGKKVVAIMAGPSLEPQDSNRTLVGLQQVSNKCAVGVWRFETRPRTQLCIPTSTCSIEPYGFWPSCFTFAQSSSALPSSFINPESNSIRGRPWSMPRFFWWFLTPSPCHKLSQILDPLRVCHTSEQKVNKQISGEWRLPLNNYNHY